MHYYYTLNITRVTYLVDSWILLKIREIITESQKEMWEPTQNKNKLVNKKNSSIIWHQKLTHSEVNKLTRNIILAFTLLWPFFN